MSDPVKKALDPRFSTPPWLAAVDAALEGVVDHVIENVSDQFLVNASIAGHLASIDAALTDLLAALLNTDVRLRAKVLRDLAGEEK